MSVQINFYLRITFGLILCLYASLHLYLSANHFIHSFNKGVIQFIQLPEWYSILSIVAGIIGIFPGIQIIKNQIKIVKAYLISALIYIPLFF